MNFDKILDFLIDRYEYTSHQYDMDEVSDEYFEGVKLQTDRLLFYYAGLQDGLEKAKRGWLA